MNGFYYVIKMTAHAANNHIITILIVNPACRPNDPICMRGASFLEFDPPLLE